MNLMAQISKVPRITTRLEICFRYISNGFSPENKENPTHLTDGYGLFYRLPAEATLQNGSVYAIGGSPTRDKRPGLLPARGRKEDFPSAGDRV